MVTDDPGWMERTAHPLLPFREAISQSGVGDREISRRTVEQKIPNSQGKIGYSHSQIVHAKNGTDGSRHIRPRPELMMAVCEVIEFPVERVAEYQLWSARRLLDEEAVGLEQALANLVHHGFGAGLRAIEPGEGGGPRVKAPPPGLAPKRSTAKPRAGRTQGKASRTAGGRRAGG